MKPSLVLISGWAMTTEVMQPLADALAVHFSVSVLALSELAEEPPSGNRWEILLNNLDQHISSTVKPAEDNVTLVGWSMGAQLSTLYASHYPAKINSLITLAGNPCFVQKTGWTAAMLPETFNTFANSANEDIRLTLKQFVGLCTKGSHNQRQQTRHIRTQLKSAPLNDHLAALLQRLGDDLRPALSDVQCPVTHLLGSRDALVPVELATTLQKYWPSHDVHTCAGGHTFFLDEPEAVMTRIYKAVDL